ncbi:hypothetical protein SLI_7900 [Streptomyces lividans 1326]|uniref:Uncharacterized protein n=1 Tax=Streptomyces lividans 1326 TaxID=1200984 RepID=A0A7U9HFP9_STRLI|nr:hypothetical protein SLI_7900 [Streptomyces lividans 1326]
MCTALCVSPTSVVFTGWSPRRRFVKSHWCYIGNVGTNEDRDRDAISELSSLDDPVRRRLYCRP